MSFQTGWVREVKRQGWTAFKICWREKDTNGVWVEKTKTMPREINGKPTVNKDAQQELSRILGDVNARQGVAVVTSGLTFSEFLDQHWADFVERSKLRDSTRDGYNAMLSNWVKEFFGDMRMVNINKETVSAFFKHLRSEGLSAQYQKNIFGLLNKLFELAIAFDVVQISPVNKMLHRAHVERGEKQVMPVEKVRAFFEALPANWKAPLSVLLLTGMRQGELLGLRWQDVDFNSKMISKRNVVFRGKLVEGLKQTRRTGRAKKHVVGMSEMVSNLLASHKADSKFANPESFVFSREDGRPLDPDHIRRYVIYPAMETAGIPRENRENGLHMFRHTVVSELAKRKGILAAQRQAGHSNIATTADTYTHVDVEQTLESANALSDAFAAHLLPVVPASQLSN